jgi:toxin ParE1/3/4
MKLIFHAAALADLQNIHRHISQDNPSVAVAVVARIRAALDRLLLFPRSGRLGTVEGTLEVVVPGLPYIVVYEIIGDRVEILAVFHGARNRS